MRVCGGCQVTQGGSEAPLESEAPVAASERLVFFMRRIGLSGSLEAGVGVLAVSRIGVRARTLEIGARRALGATAFDIFFQIIFEAVAVNALGSALGLIAGWQSSHTIAEQVNLPFVFDWENAGLAVAIAVALNLTFALLPSQRAARLDPIRALKHE